MPLITVHTRTPLKPPSALGLRLVTNFTHDIEGPDSRPRFTLDNMACTATCAAGKDHVVVLATDRGGCYLRDVPELQNLIKVKSGKIQQGCHHALAYNLLVATISISRAALGCDHICLLLCRMLCLCANVSMCVIVRSVAAPASSVFCRPSRSSHSNSHHPCLVARKKSCLKLQPLQPCKQ